MTRLPVLLEGPISIAKGILKLKTLVLFYFSVIKVWDLRKHYAAYRQDAVPCKSFCYPGTSTRKLGKLLEDVVVKVQSDFKKYCQGHLTSES